MLMTMIWYVVRTLLKMWFVRWMIDWYDCDTYTYIQVLRWSALFYAARNGHINIIERLLECLVDINHNDVDGRLAWHIAAYYHHYNIVHSLLSTPSSFITLPPVCIPLQSYHINTSAHLTTSTDTRQIMAN
jgi:hypothetical protein